MMNSYFKTLDTRGKELYKEKIEAVGLSMMSRSCSQHLQWTILVCTGSEVVVGSLTWSALVPAMSSLWRVLLFMHLINSDLWRLWCDQLSLQATTVPSWVMPSSTVHFPTGTNGLVWSLAGNRVQSGPCHVTCLYVLCNFIKKYYPLPPKISINFTLKYYFNIPLKCNNWCRHL